MSILSIYVVPILPSLFLQVSVPWQRRRRDIRKHYEPQDYLPFLREPASDRHYESSVASQCVQSSGLFTGRRQGRAATTVLPRSRFRRPVCTQNPTPIHTCHSESPTSPSCQPYAPYADVFVVENGRFTKGILGWITIKEI